METRDIDLKGEAAMSESTLNEFPTHNCSQCGNEHIYDPKPIHDYYQELLKSKDARIAELELKIESVIEDDERTCRQVKALQKELEAKQETVNFFASVIKCGEPWTEECEKRMKDYRAAASDKEGK